MEKTHIVKDASRGDWLLLIPIYYEHETRPAWRKGTRGDLETVKKALESAPEYLKATTDENRNNRSWKRAEMLFLYEHGKKTDAEKIRKQYNF